MISDDLIKQVISSGSIGMIHYWILREFDILNFFNHKHKDEKFSLLIIMTVINATIFEGVINLTHSKWNVIVYYLISFTVALILEFLLFKCLKKILSLSNSNKSNSKKDYGYQVPTLRKVIDDQLKNDNKLFSSIYVVIFDFENNFIDSGYLTYYSTDDDQNFVLIHTDDPIETDYNSFKNNLPSGVNIYISVKEKIKIYIFN